MRRAGTDVSLITYGGTLGKRSKPPSSSRRGHRGGGGRPSHAAAARYRDDSRFGVATHRAVIIDEGWRSGSISAEISARIMEGAFYELDLPVERICSAEVPMPYAKHLEDAALPQAATIVATVRGCWALMADFRMPSLGADMEVGTVLEWLVKPGDAVKRGDIVAVVDTEKAAIEVEIFQTGVIQKIVVPEGEKVPVGTLLAVIRQMEKPSLPFPRLSRNPRRAGSSRRSADSTCTSACRREA